LWKHQWGEIQDPDGVWFSFWQDEEDGAWTTDGHYYTVQLVALLMGIDEARAVELGSWSEHPDSKVTNAGKMQERYNYLHGGTQQLYHALTGRTHGMELALTLYALCHSHKEDPEAQTYLWHRFGDDFAHATSTDRRQFGEVTIDAYINAIQQFLDEYVIGKTQDFSIENLAIVAELA
jgi:hypothetical protein